MRHCKTEIERGTHTTHADSESLMLEIWNSTFWGEHCHLEGTEPVRNSEFLVQALDMFPELIQIRGWISERHKHMNKHVHDGAIEDLPQGSPHIHPSHLWKRNSYDIHIRLVWDWGVCGEDHKNIRTWDCTISSSGPCRCQGTCRASNLETHLQKKGRSLFWSACMQVRRACTFVEPTSHTIGSRTMDM